MIEIKELQKKIETSLEAQNVKYSIETNDEENKYTIDSCDAFFEATIGPKWIGYSLEIKEHVLGVPVGDTNDSDNYPLNYDEGVTKEIADELYVCLRALINGEIFVKGGEELVLFGRPLASGEYRLKITKLKKHWWQSTSSVFQTVTKDKIVSDFNMTTVRFRQ